MCLPPPAEEAAVFAEEVEEVQEVAEIVAGEEAAAGEALPVVEDLRLGAEDHFPPGLPDPGAEFRVLRGVEDPLIKASQLRHHLLLRQRHPGPGMHPAAHQRLQGQ